MESDLEVDKHPDGISLTSQTSALCGYDCVFSLCVHMGALRAERIVCDLLCFLSAGLHKGQRSGLILCQKGEVMLTHTLVCFL